MATKLTIIEFRHPRTNQALEAILTGQYVKMGGNGMLYTILGYQDVNNMQQDLMG